jgi:uncharacterized protein (DUF849 family)
MGVSIHKDRYAFANAMTGEEIRRELEDTCVKHIENMKRLEQGIRDEQTAYLSHLMALQQACNHKINPDMAKVPGPYSGVCVYCGILVRKDDANNSNQ